MNAGTSVIAGLAVVMGGACSSPIQGGSTSYTEATPISTAAPINVSAGAAAPATAITASSAHPGPSAVSASAPPAASVSAAATPPPAAAAAVPSTPAAASTTTAAPSGAAPASPSMTTTAAASSTPTAAAGSTGATKPSGFNAGSGTALPDGKTIEYHIPDGTGGNDWNPKDNPVRVRRGMVLRLIDDDKSTRAGGHWLHTNGQPCSHGLKAIGQGFDCNISMSAPTGIIPGVFEHNVANGIGQLYIEVVADAN